MKAILLPSILGIAILISGALVTAQQAEQKPDSPVEKWSGKT